MVSRFMKKLVHAYLNHSGMHHVTSWLETKGLKVCRKEDALTMEHALRRHAAEPVGTVIDVGASDGRWSLLALKAFPHARYLLVEAMADVHGRALQEFTQRHPQAEAVLAAAGDKTGTVSFTTGGAFGGAASTGQADASAEPSGQNTVTVPMTTLDAEVSRRGLPGPFLVKLDTHGAELPILAGATETLRHASLVVIEAYNFQPGIAAGVRFPELCRRMEESGFRCLDLVEPQHRPLDGALWQMDLFFAPASHAAFQNEHYAR